VSSAYQLSLDLEPGVPRWRFSRLVTRSPHFARIRRRLEFVRRHFPELDALTIRVGLAKRRGVLGWGSLDPREPGIWVRPRTLHYFTVAHELTHLLQARGWVPRGERACDLHALARAPELVDAAPGYLRLPARLRDARRWRGGAAEELCRTARRALAERAAGRRNYLRFFEQTIAGRSGRDRTRPMRRAARRSPRGGRG
jgi:hypothetical protein